jgi:hypothetical protein
LSYPAPILLYLELGLRWAGYNDHSHLGVWSLSWGNLAGEKIWRST